MPLLLDTGAIYALADADDAWHEPMREFLFDRPEILLVPATVLPEVAHLLRNRLGEAVERRFVDSLVKRELTVEPLQAPDLDRCAQLLERYRDIGFVDATVVAMAERLRLQSIVTTDRRHFAQVRPVHRIAFDLLP